MTALVEIIIIAVALAMDAFAVSLSSGVVIPKVKFRHALKIGFMFGLFQAVMPLIGYAGGSIFAEQISRFDHWIAFGLLILIGGKMIHEALSDDEDEATNPLQIKVLTTLAIATSIDALAVGVTFSVLSISIWSGVVIIGLITFILSMAGVFMGHRFSHRLGSRAEIFGGVVLIILGFKILIEHIFFA